MFIIVRDMIVSRSYWKQQEIFLFLYIILFRCFTVMIQIFVVVCLRRILEWSKVNKIVSLYASWLVLFEALKLFFSELIINNDWQASYNYRKCQMCIHCLKFNVNKKCLWNMYAPLSLNVTVTMTFDLETPYSIGVIY